MSAAEAEAEVEEAAATTLEVRPTRSASFWTQLRATVIRNLIRKKRALRHTLQVVTGDPAVLKKNKGGIVEIYQ